MITLIIADEVRGEGVPVNAVGRGWVSTRMGDCDAPRSIVEGAPTCGLRCPMIDRQAGLIDDRGPIRGTRRANKRTTLLLSPDLTHRQLPSGARPAGPHQLPQSGH